MLSLWIPITLAAAFCQNLRSALQKSLKGRLSTAGAAYARFFYAWPLAVLYVWALYHFGGYEVPDINTTFLLYCFAGGIAQILFTVVLLWMFSFRSFAVGTTFSKLDVILIAIFGAVLLGDTIGPIAIAAIVIGSIGTLFLSFQETKLTMSGMVRGLTEKATMVGLLSAALLGMSIVSFRGATLAVETPHFIMAAAFALAVNLIFQTILMGGWFLIFDKVELQKVVREWRYAAPVGVIGMAGSVCWFTAFSLQNAAYVSALGRVELVFTFIASVFFFREKATWMEIVGILLIVCAILLILLE